MIERLIEGTSHVAMDNGKAYTAVWNGRCYVFQTVGRAEELGASAKITESCKVRLGPGRYGFYISGGGGPKPGEKIDPSYWVMDDTILTITIGAQGSSGQNGEPTQVSFSGQSFIAKGGGDSKASNNNGSRSNGYVEIHRIG